MTTFKNAHRYVSEGENQNTISAFKAPQLDFPPLDRFDYGSVKSISAPDSISEYFDVEAPQSTVTENEDVWAFANHDEIDSKQPKLRTWESFYGRAVKEPVTYISEAGPCALDAVLSSIRREPHKVDSSKRADGVLCQPDRYLTALFNLGLGRESTFFNYQSEKLCFCTRVERCRLSGYSDESMKSITDIFIQYGNQIRSLQSFVDRAYAATEPFPGMIAFAGSVSSVLTVMMEHLTCPAQPPHSLLQLQSSFHRPGLILNCLHMIVSKIQNSKNDTNLLSRLYDWCQDLDHVDVSLRPIVLQLLARTSKPWLQAVGSSLGLRPRDSWSISILLKHGGDSSESPPSLLTSCMMPSFVTEGDATILVQSSKSLALLETHMLNHTLLRSATGKLVNPPCLDWHFNWTDIERIESKAKEYEINLLEAMRSHSSQELHGDNMEANSTSSPPIGSPPIDWPFGIPEEKAPIQPLLSHSHMQDSLLNVLRPEEHDLLRQSVEQCLEARVSMNRDSTFAPPLTTASLLSFSPIISAQARLINLACFQLIFKQHNLRFHLSLQQQYQLCGDGVFMSRLSQALLDPGLSSTQRVKGHARVGKVGLNLGFRESWPPASSELRLALMGILKECFESANHGQAVKSLDEDLPGGLSFAIRELSPDEIERCLDPNSIEALDFLRLQYKPPPPLDVIITKSALDKYDSVFKLLLRITRILFVTSQLFRDCKVHSSNPRLVDVTTRRFAIEARHFIVAVSSYFYDSGINAIWADFERNLDDLEGQLANDQVGNYFSEHNSLDQLQQYHEAVLDQIMSVLLLRKRQEKIMGLLKDIFGLVLLFGKEFNIHKHQDLQSTGQFNPTNLYIKFNEMVRLFIRSCRDLSGRRDHKSYKSIFRGVGKQLFSHKDLGQDGSDRIDQLVLRLEMNDYYK